MKSVACLSNIFICPFLSVSFIVGRAFCFYDGDARMVAPAVCAYASSILLIISIVTIKIIYPGHLYTVVRTTLEGYSCVCMCGER